MNGPLSLGALILSAAILHVGNGLVQTFLPIRMAADGFSSGAIGAMIAGHAVGFLAGCIAAPALIRRIGHIRVFATFASVTAVTTLAFAIETDAVLWTVLRLSTGFSSAALFTALESWLNACSARETRGSLIGAYMLANKFALIAGQMALALPLTPIAVLMAGSAIYSLCLIPLATTSSPGPDVAHMRRLGLRELYAVAPAAVAGCLAAGLVNSAVIGLAPVYATLIDLPRGLTAAVVSAMQLGTLLLQWPLGRLSDRIDRRVVILVTALGALGTSVALLAGPMLPLWSLFALFAAWGGFALSVYALSIAHANDLARADQLVGLASGLLMIWAIGSAAGPLLAAAVMDRMGPAGLFAFAGVVQGALALYTGWRLAARRGVPRLRPRFVNLPATSPAVGTLDPRAPDAR